MKKIIILILLASVNIAYCQNNKPMMTNVPTTTNTNKTTNKKAGTNNGDTPIMVPQNIDGCNVMLLPQKPKRRNTQQNNKKTTNDLFPSRVEAYICFDKGSTYYTKGGLNTLDSLYMIAFNKQNNRFYKMTITGYDDADQINEQNASLARERAVMVFKYFASREETEYIIKRTPSTYTQSCKGEVPYYIKYKMPFDFKWVNLYNLSAAERQENDISLVGKVHIIIEDDPEGCLGEYYNYDYPDIDTTLSGNNASVLIPKGSLEYIHHTKDTIAYSCDIKYKEVMSFEDLTSNYMLVPHKKQYIVNAGYIVVQPSHKPDYTKCNDVEAFQPVIKIDVPIETQQNEARLKFYAKDYKPDGTYIYKAVATKAIKNKETKEQTLEAYINAFQLDTIFIGKKIEDKEMSDYFYPAKEGEPGAFQAMGGWLKPYKLSKKGTYVIKKSMETILRKPNGELIQE